MADFKRPIGGYPLWQRQWNLANIEGFIGDRLHWGRRAAAFNLGHGGGGFNNEKGESNPTAQSDLNSEQVGPKRVFLMSSEEEEEASRPSPIHCRRQPPAAVCLRPAKDRRRVHYRRKTCTFFDLDLVSSNSR